MTKGQLSPGGQGKEIDAACGDVLTDLARTYRKPKRLQRIEEFGLYEMDLPEVRLRRIFSNPRSMLYGNTAVRVTFNAMAGNEDD